LDERATATTNDRRRPERFFGTIRLPWQPSAIGLRHWLLQTPPPFLGRSCSMAFKGGRSLFNTVYIYQSSTCYFLFVWFVCFCSVISTHSLSLHVSYGTGFSDIRTHVRIREILQVSFIYFLILSFSLSLYQITKGFII
jgi:hypothetical protein